MVLAVRVVARGASRLFSLGIDTIVNLLSVPAANTAVGVNLGGGGVLTQGQRRRATTTWSATALQQ